MSPRVSEPWLRKWLDYQTTSWTNNDHNMYNELNKLPVIKLNMMKIFENI